jgi:hypothetical protein
MQPSPRSSRKGGLAAVSWDDFCDPPATQLRAPRVDDEYPAPHRRHRSTKEWCKGKPGVPHRMQLRLKRYAARHRNVTTYCGWSPWGWRRRIHRDGDDGWSYLCLHERYCVECGKIYPLGYHEYAECCPEYAQHPRPVISAREYEATVRAKRLAAQAECAERRRARRRAKRRAKK